MPHDWDELQGSGFFSWFHLHEFDEAPAVQPGSPRVVRCQPETSGDELSLAFEIGADNAVSRALLVIARNWMEAPRTAPFAADIAKSFLLELGGDDPPIAALGGAIELQMRGSPGVISRAAPDAPPSPPAPREVMSALDCYLGRSTSAVLRGETAQILLDNGTVMQEEAASRGRFTMTWVANGAPAPHPLFGGAESPPVPSPYVPEPSKTQVDDFAWIPPISPPYPSPDADQRDGIAAFPSAPPPAYSRPPGHLPVAGLDKLVCPHGDFTWHRYSAGEKPPTCPNHGVALVAEADAGLGISDEDDGRRRPRWRFWRR